MNVQPAGSSLTAALLANPSFGSAARPSDPAAVRPPNSPVSRSFAAQAAAFYGLTEVRFSEKETILAYRKDGSLALQAVSTTQVNLKQEDFRFDLTLTAEQVGLNRADFRQPNQPITLQISFQQSKIDIEHNLRATLVKPIRSAEEIITDVAKAIAKILRDPSNKTVRYELDEEARQALIGADLKLWNELVMMMAMINLQKREGEPRNDYLILISGKRKPYLDIAEHKSVRSEMVNIHIQITILPPSDSAEQASASSSEELPQPAAGTSVGQDNP